MNRAAGWQVMVVIGLLGGMPLRATNVVHTIGKEAIPSNIDIRDSIRYAVTKIATIAHGSCGECLPPPAPGYYDGPTAFDIDEDLRIYILYYGHIYRFSDGRVARLGVQTHARASDLKCLHGSIYLLCGDTLEIYQWDKPAKARRVGLGVPLAEKYGLGGVSFFYKNYLFIRDVETLGEEPRLRYIYDLTKMKLFERRSDELGFSILLENCKECDIEFVRQLLSAGNGLMYMGQSSRFSILVSLPASMPNSSGADDISTAQFYAFDREEMSIAPLGGHFEEELGRNATLTSATPFQAVNDSTFIVQADEVSQGGTLSGVAYWKLVVIPDVKRKEED